MWSPELELLDLLLGDDESLSSALKIFGWPKDSTALERARYSIIKQISEGLIQLKRRANGSDRVLAEWEVAQVLRDDANWLTQKDETDYYVGLTEKGSRYMA